MADSLLVAVKPKYAWGSRFQSRLEWKSWWALLIIFLESAFSEGSAIHCLFPDQTAAYLDEYPEPPGGKPVPPPAGLAQAASAAACSQYNILNDLYKSFIKQQKLSAGQFSRTIGWLKKIFVEKSAVYNLVHKVANQNLGVSREAAFRAIMSAIFRDFAPDAAADAQIILKKLNSLTDESTGISFIAFHSTWMDLFGQLEEMKVEPSLGTITDITSKCTKNPAFSMERGQLKKSWSLELSNLQLAASNMPIIPIPHHLFYSWSMFFADCFIKAQDDPEINNWAVKGKRDEGDIKASKATVTKPEKHKQKSQKQQTDKPKPKLMSVDHLCFVCGRNNHYVSECTATSCTLCGAKFLAVVPGKKKPHDVHICQGVPYPPRDLRGGGERRGDGEKRGRDSAGDKRKRDGDRERGTQGDKKRKRGDHYGPSAEDRSLDRDEVSQMTNADFLALSARVRAESKVRARQVEYLSDSE
jgi:hypothetical protein